MNYLLAIKNDIVYSKFTRAINPLILGKWNWSAVMPQQFNRLANSSYLLTVLVPLIFNIYYLLLLFFNIIIPQKTKKERNG
tara:strand:- start:730 stop:972 length:243 start_codon:yes stop_codon:yes gene_type:complete